MPAIIQGVLLPFLGTVLGAACVFFMKQEFRSDLRQILTGFAGGIMTAASIWSLLLPALAQAETAFQKLAFLPVVSGFLLGIGFLLYLEKRLPISVMQKKSLFLAVTIHNIPEGMAVGIACAGVMCQESGMTATSAFLLTLGIAIQNFPEGAIISMPMKADGTGRTKAFCFGALSGAVEPLACLVTFFTAGLFLPVMPFFLSFAAGAMIYVVIRELIPEMYTEQQFSAGVLSYAGGFVLMIILDVLFA